MLIGLVRHGETDWNAARITQGQTDIPLNDAGILQAKALANRLAQDEKVWDGVMSSDLLRANVTGQHIAEALHIPLIGTDVRLRERFFGEVEGTNEEQRIARWGEQWRELDLGVESDLDMTTRGMALLDELYAENPNRNILCVTHGSFIAYLMLALIDNLEDSRIGNLSYNILERSENGWRLVLHNCTKHLECV